MSEQGSEQPAALASPADRTTSRPAAAVREAAAPSDADGSPEMVGEMAPASPPEGDEAVLVLDWEDEPAQDEGAVASGGSEQTVVSEVFDETAAAAPATPGEGVPADDRTTTAMATASAASDPLARQVPEPESSLHVERLASLEAELVGLRETVAASRKDVASLLKAFERRLAYDKGKDTQIDRLHAELQEHRRDLLARTLRPLLNSVVGLHNGMRRVLTSLAGRDPASLTPVRAMKVLEGFAQDVEELLEQHGVQRYHHPSDRFEPRRQRALDKTATSDPALVGQVATRIGPGFEHGSAILQKESVAVYVQQRPSVSKATRGASAKPASEAAPGSVGDGKQGEVL